VDRAPAHEEIDGERVVDEWGPRTMPWLAVALSRAFGVVLLVGALFSAAYAGLLAVLFGGFGGPVATFRSGLLLSTRFTLPLVGGMALVFVYWIAGNVYFGSARYVVTDDGVVSHRETVLETKTRGLRWDEVSSVSTEAGPIGSVLDTGSVTIEAESGEPLTVHHPEDLDDVVRAIDRVRGTRA
jgi:uncharacterized membrane protein YdbT with pleckstrin-like domain